MKTEMSTALGREASDSRRSEPAKKSYATPKLTSWGSIVALTNGPINGNEDMNFSGTGGA